MATLGRLGLAWALALGAPGAWGTLGQAAGSIGADAARMKGQLQTLPGRGYAVEQIVSPDGELVREYVGPAGVVFAVSWQGPAMPDMAQLLGDNFTAYEQAAAAHQAAHPGRGPLHLASGPLRVDNAGTPRALHGRAWRTDLLPAGLSAAVIQ